MVADSRDLIGTNGKIIYDLASKVAGIIAPEGNGTVWRDTEDSQQLPVPTSSAIAPNQFLAGFNFAPYNRRGV